MKIEIVTTTETGFVVEKVVGQDKVTERTKIKDFLTWYAARLFKGPFNLQRDDNVFGWAAVDSRGNDLHCHEQGRNWIEGYASMRVELANTNVQGNVNEAGLKRIATCVRVSEKLGYTLKLRSLYLNAGTRTGEEYGWWKS